MPGHPFHFAYQNGAPCWLMGDTGWRAFATDAASDLDRESVLHYFDVRASQGFNYVHVDLMGGAGIDGQQQVLFDFEQERLNPGFFHEVDARLDYMNTRGITCGLLPAWSRGAESWESLISDEARLRFARYLVARYSAMDVVFIVAGEWDLLGREHKDTYLAIGQEIMRTDPHQRLRGIHACRSRSVQEFATEPWISFGDYQQLYCAPHDRESTAPERAGLHHHLLGPRVHGKPVINAEYAYYLRQMGTDHSYHRSVIHGVDKPHSHSRASFRRASWALAMAGGYFVSGFGTTYFGGWRELGNFDVDTPKNDVAESDLANLKRFFTDLEWWRLQPMDHLVRPNAGKAYCLAELERTFVVYCEGSRRVALNLPTDTERPGGRRWRLRRYDPRQGSHHDLERVVEDEQIVLWPPDDQDWAFVVTRETEHS
jgi:hypothetical protein